MQTGLRLSEKTGLKRQDIILGAGARVRGTKRVTKRDLAHRGEAIEEFDIVVFDESHYLKNLTASRTKFAIELYQSARFLLWLSATAGQEPLELGYTFPILAKQTGSKAISTKDFEQWCVKSFTGFLAENTAPGCGQDHKRTNERFTSFFLTKMWSATELPSGGSG